MASLGSIGFKQCNISFQNLNMPSKDEIKQSEKRFFFKLSKIEESSSEVAKKLFFQAQQCDTLDIEDHLISSAIQDLRNKSKKERKLALAKLLILSKICPLKMLDCFRSTCYSSYQNYRDHGILELGQELLTHLVKIKKYSVLFTEEMKEQSVCFYTKKSLLRQGFELERVSRELKSNQLGFSLFAKTYKEIPDPKYCYIWINFPPKKIIFQSVQNIDMSTSHAKEQQRPNKEVNEALAPSQTSLMGNLCSPKNRFKKQNILKLKNPLISLQGVFERQSTIRSVQSRDSRRRTERNSFLIKSKNRKNVSKKSKKWNSLGAIKQKSTEEYSDNVSSQLSRFRLRMRSRRELFFNGIVKQIILREQRSFQNK